MAECRNAIAELEAWRGAHKARSVRIDIDNGYGATCWCVGLVGEGCRKVALAEIDLMRIGENDDWPGLEKLILAALDKWSKEQTAS